MFFLYRNSIEAKPQKSRKKTSSEKLPKSRNLSKSNPLTIDIPSTDISKIEEENDDIDIHEYVNLVDIQRYREEVNPHQNAIGSNPILNFPNVIGYASTQHILALYGNPRTPLLPDYFQRGSTLGIHTQGSRALSRLSTVVPSSPMDNQSKTMSNSDLRSQTILTRFSQNHVNNRRACSTLDISDQRAARQFRNHVPASRGNLTLDYHRPNRNIGSNDVVY